MHDSSKKSFARLDPLLPEPLQQLDRTFVRSGRRKLIYFAGCDYFRLASHPEILAAARQALKTHGLGVSASRKTTGNHPLFGQLEAALADFFESPTAVLVSAGYITNLVVAQALNGRFTHVLIDERAHTSLQEAAVLLGLPTLTFRHRTPAHVAQLIDRLTPPAIPLLLTDGMFSHDGSLAPLREYLAILPRKSRILLDEAHAAGVLGEHGRGTLELLRLPPERFVRTMTLSKAFGAYGGAILCGPQIRKLILTRSRMFAGHTPLPLPLAEAALRSVRLLQQEHEMRDRLQANTEFVKSQLRAAGISIPETPGPIISFVPKNAAQAGRLKASLLRGGIYPSLIRYPGGPRQGYFRFMISSEHTRPQLQKLISCLKGVVA